MASSYYYVSGRYIFRENYIIITYYVLNEFTIALTASTFSRDFNDSRPLVVT